MGVRGMPQATARLEEFAELIYADDEFVRAEFAALIAASWPTPPPVDPPPAPPQPSRRPPRWPSPPVRDGLAVSATQPRRLGPRWRRQRSPPSPHRVPEGG